jgi:hypothetical protein
MQNSKYFHLFSFTPNRLTEERLKLEEQYKNIEQEIALNRIYTQLPKLLAKIRATALEGIYILADSLSKMDIRLLVYEYPFHKEKRETRQKINKILASRYTSIVGKTAWDLFQQDISDPLLLELIRDSYHKERETFLGIKEEYLAPFEKAMSKNESILTSLASFMAKSNLKSEKLLKEWKVRKDSVLDLELIKQMFYSGLHESFIISRDGEEFVVKALEKFAMNDYKKALKIYLEARSFEQFHDSIVHNAVKSRLGDPLKHEADWRFLSEKALLQVKRWVIQKNLIEIFASDANNERFNYWKRFIKYMHNVELLEDPKVAFIYFKDFVVVEFGNIGAAYFYHKTGFEKFILPIKYRREFRTKRTSAKEDMLKDRVEVKQDGTKLFLTKLDHRGQIWTYKFDQQMQTYLRGLK